MRLHGEPEEAVVNVVKSLESVVERPAVGNVELCEPTVTIGLTSMCVMLQSIDLWLHKTCCVYMHCLRRTRN